MNDDRDRRIQDYLDDRMDADERAAYEREMEQDPVLAAEVEALRDVGDALRDLDAPMPAGLVERARARFESERAAPPAAAHRRVPWEALGLAAAALIVGAILVPWDRFGPAEPPPEFDGTGAGREQAARAADDAMPTAGVPDADHPGGAPVTTGPAPEVDDQRRDDDHATFRGPAAEADREPFAPVPQPAATAPPSSDVAERAPATAKAAAAGSAKAPSAAPTAEDAMPRASAPAGAGDAARAEATTPERFAGSSAVPVLQAGAVAVALPEDPRVTARGVATDTVATVDAGFRPLTGPGDLERWMAGEYGPGVRALAGDGDWTALGIVVGPADCERVRVERTGAGTRVIVPHGPDARCMVRVPPDGGPVEVVREGDR